MKEEFKAAAIRRAKARGLINLSRVDLCEEMGVPVGSFATQVGMNYVDFVAELREEGHTGPPHTDSPARANGADRKAQLLDVALGAVKIVGFHQLTRKHVAEGAGVSKALVAAYYNTMDELRDAVMHRAIELDRIDILAQGLGVAHHVATAAPKAMRQQAVNYLMSKQ